MILENTSGKTVSTHTVDKNFDKFIDKPRNALRGCEMHLPYTSKCVLEIAVPCG